MIEKLCVHIERTIWKYAARKVPLTGKLTCKRCQKFWKAPCQLKLNLV